MNMKFAICLIASFVAIASANYLAAPIPATVNTGASSQYRSQDSLGQYAFGYDESGATGGTFRHEKSDALGNRVGSYGLRGADGRIRIVNYVADANGYRANVQTNEPGTESRDTAGVAVNKAALEVAPAPLPVAPVAAAPLAPLAAAPLAPLAAAPLEPFAAAPLAPLAAAPLAAPLAAAPLAAAPLAAPLPAPLPVLAPHLGGFGYSVVSHHLAPLPAY